MTEKEYLIHLNNIMIGRKNYDHKPSLDGLKTIDLRSLKQSMEAKVETARKRGSSVIKGYAGKQNKHGEIHVGKAANTSSKHRKHRVQAVN